MSIKISIITPSFNQGKFIEETIQSVFSQEYTNLEYIIIDGNSTDNSIDIIQKYSEQLSYWISEKDHGQAAAINKGFNIASGDIIGWLNSDDILLPGALDKISNAFISHPDIDVVYGDYFFIDENSKILLKKKEIPVDFKIMLYGKDLTQFSLETVQMFYNDAKSAGYFL
jgi:glycosyltransferase involved in cell wall biosynthesis